MLRIKQGVRSPLILAWGVRVAEGVFLKYGQECVITSANDSKHKDGSFHYQDRAVDLRMHHVPAVKRADLVRDLRDALGPDWDVLWEFVGTPQEHIHIEHDPK